MSVIEKFIGFIIISVGLFTIYYCIYRLILEIWLGPKIEFNRINKGDVYRKDVSDPWNKEKYTYIIKDKRDGWVKVYRPRDPGCVETMKIGDLLNSGYKCIKRNKQ